MKDAPTTHPADLDMIDAATALAEGTLSSSDLVEACLERIEERNGAQSHDGDSESINAWVRIYANDARAAATLADDRRRAETVERLGPAPTLCGVPVGLQDLLAVADKPLTASARFLDEQPTADCTVWARMRASGMVLLGHLHTHEFGAGATTDQVGNPWDLSRSAGGSAGGPAAALAARMIPAAVGMDTFGSLRIPAALCGVSGLKPTRGSFPMDGVVPLCPQLENIGPMAHTVADCALLYQVMSGKHNATPLRSLPLAGTRIGRSPRKPSEPDEDVADAFEAALDLCVALGADVVPVEAPASLDTTDYLNVFGRDILDYHKKFASYRDLYRPSVRGLLEQCELNPIGARDLDTALANRHETIAAWMEWFATRDVLALIEPTVVTVAPTRGGGYERFGANLRLGHLSHYWNWTGFPVVSVPAGVGGRSGLPVGVSLIGPRGTDLEVLRAAMTLQSALGVLDPPEAP